MHLAILQRRPLLSISEGRRSAERSTTCTAGLSPVCSSVQRDQVRNHVGMHRMLQRLGTAAAGIALSATIAAGVPAFAQPAPPPPDHAPLPRRHDPVPPLAPLRRSWRAIRGREQTRVAAEGVYAGDRRRRFPYTSGGSLLSPTALIFRLSKGQLLPVLAVCSLSSWSSMAFPLRASDSGEVAQSNQAEGWSLGHTWKEASLCVLSLT